VTQAKRTGKQALIVRMLAHRELRGAMDSLVITKLAIILSLIIAMGAAVLLILFMLSFVLGGAPFVPTPSRVLHKMMELADIKPGEKVYDLGCGDGRLIIEARKKYRAKAVGIEISPLVYLLARLRAFLSGADVTFILGNFLDHDISNADVVFCYLLEGHMKKLQDKFKTLKRDCRIVCHQFEIPGWEPEVRVQVEGKSYVAAVFKYEVSGFQSPAMIMG
jgi:SAM-dependent methyltransferase